MLGVVEPGPRQAQSPAHSPGAKRHLRPTRTKGQGGTGLAQVQRDAGSDAKTAEEAEGHVVNALFFSFVIVCSVSVRMKAYLIDMFQPLSFDQRTYYSGSFFDEPF